MGKSSKNSKNSRSSKSNSNNSNSNSNSNSATTTTTTSSSQDREIINESAPLLPSYSPAPAIVQEAASVTTTQSNHRNRSSSHRNNFNFGFRGDVSVRPNTGETNSYEYALFGLALHELLRNLRNANLILCSTSILLVLVDWIWQILFLYWRTAVVSGGLAAAAALLGLVEVLGVLEMHKDGDNESSSQNTNWPVRLQAHLQDNFGWLYHPVGKSVYIAGFLAPLALSLSSFSGSGSSILWVLIFLGFEISGGSLGLAWMIYPEFRRPFDDDDNYDGGRQQASGTPKALSATSSSWSYYSGSSWGSEA